MTAPSAPLAAAYPPIYRSGGPPMDSLLDDSRGPAELEVGYGPLDTWRGIRRRHRPGEHAADMIAVRVTGPMKVAVTPRTSPGGRRVRRSGASQLHSVSSRRGPQPFEVGIRVRWRATAG
jgi:hypothetical protein